MFLMAILTGLSQGGGYGGGNAYLGWRTSVYGVGGESFVRSYLTSIGGVGKNGVARSCFSDFDLGVGAIGVRRLLCSEAPKKRSERLIFFLFLVHVF